jgi:peptidylprolyl isomerase
MKRSLAISAMLTLACPLLAQEEAPVTPGSIVAAAPAGDWVAIAPEDLLVMDLAPDAEGNPRRVIIQLMPPPFSQGWVENIKTLAKQHWWDGTSVYRVQDNYVVQWGGGAVEKEDPEGLNVVPESAYVSDLPTGFYKEPDYQAFAELIAKMRERGGETVGFISNPLSTADNYAANNTYWSGWPFGSDYFGAWPIHCYGMVGVARGIDNTGSGSDLYVVIGHAPRQLDRNIAVVGRVIEGIEHLSSLPRGKGDLGFYDEGEEAKRVPILSVRLGNEVQEIPLPHFEYLSTESDSFAAYVQARANRQDDFYKVPAGGVDVCNVPVPIRRAPAE